jgi:hypothetical protein
LSVAGFDLGIPATFGLPSSGLPAVGEPHAFGILAVALVPALSLVPPAAAFAETNPYARSAPSG